MKAINKQIKQQPALESKVQKDYILTQKIYETIRSYGVPLLGGFGGFLVTHGPGGAGTGMALTSIVMCGCFEETKISPILNTGYMINFSVGASTAGISAVYNLFK